MAKPAKPPDPLKRRHLVEEALPAPARSPSPRRYLADGRALRRGRRSSRKAGESERLRALRAERASREGDVVPGARDRRAPRRGAGRRHRWSARRREAADAAGKER